MQACAAAGSCIAWSARWASAQAMSAGQGSPRVSPAHRAASGLLARVPVLSVCSARHIDRIANAWYAA